VTGFTNFKYIDCDGIEQNASASDFNPTNVCVQANTLPSIILGGDQYGGWDISEVDCCVI